MTQNFSSPRPIPDKCWLDADGRLCTPHNTNPHVVALRQIQRGLYDLQKTRIATGNRLCAQVRLRLGQLPGLPADRTLSPSTIKLLEDIREAHKHLGTAVASKSSSDIADEADGLESELDDSTDAATKKEAKIQERLMALLEEEYNEILTGQAKKPKKAKKGKEVLPVDAPAEAPAAPPADDGEIIAPVPKFPSKKSFKGRLVISQYTELTLAAMYMDLLAQEQTHTRRLQGIIEEFEVYRTFLDGVNGCGPMMSSVILANLDPYIARHPSSFWKYCGLDVVCGEGRSRSENHQIKRQYTDKAGKQQERMSITFNPDVKTKLVGVMSTCLVKAGLRNQYDSEDKKTRKKIGQKAITKYGQIFADYKARLDNHAIYGKHNDGKPDLGRIVGSGNPDAKYILTCGGRRVRMALRYMVKMFLIDLHIAWRKAEGLPVSLPYHEAKLGYKHGGESAVGI